MSNNSNNSAASGGVGLGGVIFAIFLALKLAEVGTVAHWSWWWVTSPLWIPLGLVLAIVAVVAGFVAGGKCIDAIADSFRRRRRMAAMMAEDDAGPR